MEIKHVHGLIISSEKVDDCPSNNSDLVLFLIFITTFTLGCISTLFFIPPEYSTPSDKLGGVAGFIVTCVWFTSWGYFGYERLKSCGCRISLKAPVSIERRDEYIYAEQSYQFTTNPDQDADEIKKIVAGFEKIATRIHFEKQAKREKERDDLKKCCDQYTTVLGKVK